MGTRADYYIMDDMRSLVWLGSTGWDGYPSGMVQEFIEASTQEEYLEAFAVHVATRDDFTHPDMGWPWPWEDSNTTDYAYVFDPEVERIIVSCFGSPWYLPHLDDDPPEDGSLPDFPQYGGAKQGLTLDKYRSGMIVIR